MLEAVSAVLICILILVLAYFCTRFLGKTWNRSQKGRYLEVIDQVAVGQDRALLIVQVNGHYYLLGSTSGGISLLAELDEDFTPLEEETPSMGGSLGNPAEFKELFLKNLKQAGVRGNRRMGRKDRM